ncbi:chymotrypsin-C [Anabrus simplex]|uniref:chymotrypsin-C n=1 Tax=Anabrus simplex TaxID=316456 RepID=UPI0035A2B7A1
MVATGDGGEEPSPLRKLPALGQGGMVEKFYPLSDKKEETCACERYKQYYIDNTGRRMDRAAIEDEFSYVAALGFIQKNSLASKPKVAWLCGGALISAKYVLTTAHCVTDPKKGSLKKARIGVIASARDKIFDVDEIIPHEDFDPPVKYNDIALVKLAQTISLSVRFLLPCLSMDGNSDKTDSFAIIGWDAATTAGDDQRRLIQKFNVDFHECSAYFKGTYFPEGIKDSMLCSAYKSTTSTTNPDTCKANSGGLLVKKMYDYPVLIGLASFTHNTACDMRNPSIYTDVSYYLKWIECIVWGNEGVIQQ